MLITKLDMLLKSAILNNTIARISICRLKNFNILILLKNQLVSRYDQ